MSLLAEQNVIGALMIDANSIDKICNDLLPEMFTDSILGAVYAEYLKGYNQGYEINLVVLNEKIDLSIPREVLNREVLDCVQQTPTSASIKSYAQAVIDDYKAEQVKALMSHTEISGADINKQINELMSGLESMQETENTDTKSLGDIAASFKDKYGQDDDAERLYLGFPKLDDMLQGMEGGDMIVIGARPAVGKSAFVTQVSYHLAESGKKIHFYSLEMQEKQMYERFLANESGLGVQRIRRAKKFNAEEQEKFDKANEKLINQKQIVITTGSRSVSEIRAENRHADYDLIIIDYLQLLKPDTQYRGNRYAEVGAISHAIKNLAMELNIPIIALSQMNRVSEQRETKEPTMAELRESGDVEQDASVIILLWNQDEQNKALKGCKVEKQRQGETGKFDLYFDGDNMHFEEAESDNPFM